MRVAKKENVAGEEALKQTVERLEALMDEIPVGVANIDIKGKITYFNKKFEEVSGYSREEIVGKNAFKLGLFPPETLKLLTRRVRERLLGKPLSPLEIQLKRKDGKWIWLEEKTKLLKERGVPIGLQTIGEDITERKRAEGLYQTLASSSPIGVYTVQNRKFQFVNPQFQKYTGFTEDELLGIDPLSIVHPEDRQMVRENAVEMLKGNRSAPYEFRAITKRGETIWAMETVTSIHYKGERATLGNFMDITERKRMEQELREAQEQLIRSERLAAIGELAGGVGHELRNPLGAIKNAVYYVKGKVAESELGQKKSRITEFLNIMDGEIDACNKIISDLLGFSRVGKPSVSPTQIKNVIEDTLSRIAIPENIKATKKVDADLHEVEIDAGQVQQVLVNMIMNAAEAMPEGGKLTIGARGRGKFLEVEIADRGCGIPQEAVGKIFDPLFTTKAKGIGLGLAVCKTIIDRHKGNIEVKSRVGKGTTFKIRLPLKAE